MRGAQAGNASDVEALFRAYWPSAHRAAFLVVVAPFTKTVAPGDLARYAACGVDELVVVDAAPERADAVAQWIDALTTRWRPRG